MLLSCSTVEMVKRLGSDAQALRAIARAGFEACDFSMWQEPWKGGVFDLPDDQFDAHFTSLRTVARDCGIQVVQTHAPFPTTTGNAATDSERLDIMRRAIHATALLGSTIIVIHPAMHVQYRTEAEHREVFEANLVMYRSLIPTLAQEGVKIGLENMFGWDNEKNHAIPTIYSTAEEMVEALEALGSDHFCACLDIGHAGIVGQSPAAMIKTLGRWLRALHVHDNDGVTDLHTLPFLGRINWEEVCQALSDVGYPGAMSLETDGFPGHFPELLFGSALRLMADTANHLCERVQRLR